MPRKRYPNGQLKPLSTTPNPARQEKREYRAHISREHAITRGIAVGCIQVLQRPLLGRLKWLVRGK